VTLDRRGGILENRQTRSGRAIEQLKSEKSPERVSEGQDRTETSAITKNRRGGSRGGGGGGRRLTQDPRLEASVR